MMYPICRTDEETWRRTQRKYASELCNPTLLRKSGCARPPPEGCKDYRHQIKSDRYSEQKSTQSIESNWSEKRGGENCSWQGQGDHQKHHADGHQNSWVLDSLAETHGCFLLLDLI